MNYPKLCRISYRERYGTINRDNGSCEPSIGTSIVEKGVVNLNISQYGYPNLINYSSEKNLQSVLLYMSCTLVKKQNLEHSIMSFANPAGWTMCMTVINASGVGLIFWLTVV